MPPWGKLWKNLYNRFLFPWLPLFVRGAAAQATEGIDKRGFLSLPYPSLEITRAGERRNEITRAGDEKPLSLATLSDIALTGEYNSKKAPPIIKQRAGLAHPLRLVFAVILPLRERFHSVSSRNHSCNRYSSGTSWRYCPSPLRELCSRLRRRPKR